MTADEEYLIQAWSNGAIIEVLFDVNPEVWVECKFPEWDSLCKYRVKSSHTDTKEDDK